MFVTYCIVSVAIIIGGVVLCFMIGADEDLDHPVVALRWISLWTLGTWTAAIAWPVLLVLLVPALMVYGVVTAFKVRKYGDLDYPAKSATINGDELR
jgi:hypothetical protein